MPSLLIAPAGTQFSFEAEVLCMCAMWIKPFAYILNNERKALYISFPAALSEPQAGIQRGFQCMIGV